MLHIALSLCLSQLFEHVLFAHQRGPFIPFLNDVIGLCKQGLLVLSPSLFVQIGVILGELPPPLVYLVDKALHHLCQGHACAPQKFIVLGVEALNLSAYLVGEEIGLVEELLYFSCFIGK
jgi:hypothetical protein